MSGHDEDGNAWSGFIGAVNLILLAFIQKLQNLAGLLVKYK